jgi:hypothetical protein
MVTPMADAFSDEVSGVFLCSRVASERGGSYDRENVEGTGGEV